MTVTNTQSKSVYTADGSNVNWAIPWPYLEDADIQIWTIDLASNMVQILANYSIDDPNSQVIYPTAESLMLPVTAGWTVVIIRVLPLTQLVDLITQGYNNLSVFEGAYDRLTLIVQQMQEQLSRSVQYPIQTSPTNPTPAQLLNVINAAVIAASGIKNQYKAMVGAESWCTHATLAAALADPSVVAGSRILIYDSFNITTSITISTANLLIEAMPNVTFTDGGANNGFIIAAAGVRIRGIRFASFATNGIKINNTFNNNFITECRFYSCANDVLDSNTTPNNVILGNITE